MTNLGIFNDQCDNNNTVTSVPCSSWKNDLIGSFLRERVIRIIHVRQVLTTCTDDISVVWFDSCIWIYINGLDYGIVANIIGVEQNTSDIIGSGSIINMQWIYFGGKRRAVAKIPFGKLDGQGGAIGSDNSDNARIVELDSIVAVIF